MLTERTPAPEHIPPIYLDFARELRPHDYVLTFNYDTLLERALDMVQKDYRLFPDRYSEIRGGTGYTVASEEVTVLKMHGSVDWFNKKEYDESDERHRKIVGKPLEHPLFGPNPSIQAVPILEGPQFEDDPLRHIRRVKHVESLYRIKWGEFMQPWLLPPSTTKFVYLDNLLPLWRGMSRAGGYNLGLVVIGYSLPPHDNYVKLPLFDMADNYQSLYWGGRGFRRVGKESPRHFNRPSSGRWVVSRGLPPPLRVRASREGAIPLLWIQR